VRFAPQARLSIEFCEEDAMGFELVIEPDNLGGGGVLAGNLRKLQLEADCLRNSWDGALPKEELMLLCVQCADRLGLQNAGNVAARQKGDKSFKPSPNRLEYMSKGEVTTLAFVTQSDTIGGEIRPDKFGSKCTKCPSCQATIGKGGKTSLAHNVIPQVIWAEVIDAAVQQFHDVVKTDALAAKTDQNGKPLAKRFDENKSLYADKEGTLLDAKALIAKSPKTMQQLHAINNYFGAQGGSQQQCPNCELIQSNATLLQRAKLVHDNAIPESYFSKIPQNTFVGAQWSALTATGGDSVLVKATLRQVGRYMQGLEERLAKLYGEQMDLGFKHGPDRVEPLVFMIWDHMQEFTWSFRSAALVKCGMPYSRTDTALKVKSVVG
jgi:hypothetical protein